ncbi:nitroreductase family protein [Solibacillus daqui]|uniref:nitroreductase family protein n=1 Tax=Solibacillus daqui TaxID=2912187 RepID=UPI002366F7C1|nr:nitroreductase family protein [Solibacillus daqui]
MTTTITSAKNIMYARKSVRKYKEGVTIPQEVLHQLIEDAISAPSSSNMQPWRFLVIQDQDVKNELLPIANNQQQVATCSALIAVLGDLEMYERSEEIYQANVELGAMPQNVADMMIANSRKLYSSLPQDVLKSIISFDAGLVSMQLMLLAKEMGYDTVTMGGFNKVQFAQYFNLPANEIPIVLIALGEAEIPAHGTSRIAAEKITRFI